MTVTIKPNTPTKQTPTKTTTVHATNKDSHQTAIAYAIKRAEAKNAQKKKGSK